MEGGKREAIYLMVCTLKGPSSLEGMGSVSPSLEEINIYVYICALEIYTCIVKLIILIKIFRHFPVYLKIGSQHYSKTNWLFAYKKDYCKDILVKTKDYCK